MALHELTRLADHIVDESLGALGVAVSCQQRKICCLQAISGIAPRLRPDILPLGKASCDEDLQCMFDLVVVPSNLRVLATDVPPSVAIGDDGDVEAPVTELHRDHG